jgi:subtilisin family serine protease
VTAVLIGVVDTSVDRENSRFRHRKPAGIGVHREGETYRFVPDFHDLHGHGTAIASLIRSFCRTASIHAVRTAQEDENGGSLRYKNKRWRWASSGAWTGASASST